MLSTVRVTHATIMLTYPFSVYIDYLFNSYCQVRLSPLGSINVKFQIALNNIRDYDAKDQLVFQAFV